MNWGVLFQGLRYIQAGTGWKCPDLGLGIRAVGDLAVTAKGQAGLGLPRGKPQGEREQPARRRGEGDGEGVD